MRGEGHDQGIAGQPVDLVRFKAATMTHDELDIQSNAGVRELPEERLTVVLKRAERRIYQRAPIELVPGKRRRTRSRAAERANIVELLWQSLRGKSNSRASGRSAQA